MQPVPDIEVDRKAVSQAHAVAQFVILNVGAEQAVPLGRQDEVEVPVAFGFQLRGQACKLHRQLSREFGQPFIEVADVAELQGDVEGLRRGHVRT
ncbi:hypothetical protein [uncultured Aquabacterium sp.]|uniref:hypothetical protein n=1 Tax=uncultured Aquabacterium sp. TaxID=158753 RepID=UPI0025D872B8|nr:hypothetical protein [uncultured Aquabacterium sp.]